jgi:hypothetical protein
VIGIRHIARTISAGGPFYETLCNSDFNNAMESSDDGGKPCPHCLAQLRFLQATFK